MIKIRKAGLKDIDSIIKLEKKLIKHSDKIIKNSYPKNLKDFYFNESRDEIARNFIKNAIHSKNGLVIIAEINEEKIGYLLITIRNNFPFFKLKKYGKLQTIYVKEEYRNKGISSKLKDEAFKWCIKKGIKRISLDVLPNNFNAINIYKKWGFSPYLLEMRVDTRK
jgi:ribosomal protein S18 acetylase RimI-like enzyme